ncbi:MAG TPA: DUF6496 domain-containing protein [Candidatus Saccharimonadales bacterium]|jgi:hypothetical protein|nr:DUF6496 domain-containing protein [Candidatus Saccharimonadales bacterium]
MPGVGPTLNEYEQGTLHSGSKNGPIVRSRKQAIAIGLDEDRRAGKSVPPRPKKRRPTIGRAIEEKLEGGRDSRAEDMRERMMRR